MRVLKLLAIIFLVISPFLLHIWRKNMVNLLNIKIERLSREVRIIRSKVVGLRTIYRKEKSPPMIELRARAILNMRYPQSGEIIRLRSFSIKGKKYGR